MRQPIDIPSGFAALCAEGKPGALATVVAVEGSAYRRPGARMLIAEDGRTWGGVSGGCLERDVAHRGRGVIVTGACVLHRYDTIDDEGLSLGAATGCGGTVDVFIQPIRADHPGPIDAMRNAARMRQAQVIGTVLRSACGTRTGQVVPVDSASTDTLPRIDRRTIDGEVVDLFLECITPPQALVIFGGGPDVVPLVSIAKTLGWHVTVIGAYPSTHLHERFASADAVYVTSGDAPTRDVPIPPDSAVCVMTHNLVRDALILTALPADLPYVGLLGPRHRTDRVMLEVKRSQPIRHLHTPIGLDLGAESSEEIALAIAAEIQAVLRNRSGVPLVHRPGPIHNDRPVSTAIKPSSFTASACSL